MIAVEKLREQFLLAGISDVCFVRWLFLCVFIYLNLFNYVTISPNSFWSEIRKESIMCTIYSYNLLQFLAEINTSGGNTNNCIHFHTIIKLQG